MGRIREELVSAAERMGLSRRELEELVGSLGREPTELELGLFALNWSEHCSYKSSRRSLARLPRDGPRVLLGPGENAGAVSLDDELCVVFKMESHNHPSAVEPFHGAATGVGGILRDILALGARPIAFLDALRFGPPGDPKARRLLSGVVAGISHYGNCVGVPTVGGDLYFDDAYADNPLVNVMCVGLVPRGKLRRAVGAAGKKLLLVGARTGPDGIHGATFASEDLEDPEKNRPNVQIGDPFMGKLLVEGVLSALERFPDIVGVQDLGAGGLATAPAEMAARGGVGVELWLDRVPLRMQLSPLEILLSESQERMVLCVDEEAELVAHFRRWGLEAAVIGRFVPEPVVRVRYRDEVLAEVPLEALQEAPEPPLSARAPVRPAGRDPDPRGDWREVLLPLLSSPNLGSRRPIFEQYDHMVQLNTVVPPGNGDAAVLRVKGKPYGLALTVDGNGRYCALDPKVGAAIATCEAARNLVAVGAEPLGLTNCLNFASPQDPEVFFAFGQAVEGLAEAAEALGIPVVSGNVSFYNQSPGRRIHPSPIVGMVGFLPDVRRRVPQGFQAEGDVIFLVGKQEGEGIGGSLFLSLLEERAEGKLDPVDLSFEARLLKALLSLAREGKLRAAHDVSEGGILAAVAEMCLWGGMGARLEAPDSLTWLFGEWQSRFVVAVAPGDTRRFAAVLAEAGVPSSRIGVAGGDALAVNGRGIPLEELRRAYSAALEFLEA